MQTDKIKLNWLRGLLSKSDHELYLIEYFPGETSAPFLPFVTEEEWTRELGREVREYIRQQIVQLENISDAPKAS